METKNFSEQIISRGNHEEIMAFLDYLKDNNCNTAYGTRLNSEASLALIDRGNHQEIMTAIENLCFFKRDLYDVFKKILERGNHDEIMALLRYPEKEMYLEVELSLKLIARGITEEIILAIERKRLSSYDGGTFYGFNELLDRGNHDEIMAFLDYEPQKMHLGRELSVKLISRGNHDEIMKAIINECFIDYHTSNFFHYTYYSYGFCEILNRDNHEEIMAFLYCLEKRDMRLTYDESKIFCRRKMSPIRRQEFEYAVKRNLIDSVYEAMRLDRDVILEIRGLR